MSLSENTRNALAPAHDEDLREQWRNELERDRAEAAAFPRPSRFPGPGAAEGADDDEHDDENEGDGDEDEEGDEQDSQPSFAFPQGTKNPREEDKGQKRQGTLGANVSSLPKEAREQLRGQIERTGYKFLLVALGKTLSVVLTLFPSTFLTITGLNVLMIAVAFQKPEGIKYSAHFRLLLPLGVLVLDVLYIALLFILAVFIVMLVQQWEQCTSGFIAGAQCTWQIGSAAVSSVIGR